MLFIDDIGALLKKEPYFGVNLQTYINALKKNKISYFPIITTNNLSDMPKGLISELSEGVLLDEIILWDVPFARFIECKRPNTEQREAVYRFYGERNGLNNIDYSYLAEVCSNVTYNDAKTIISNAFKDNGKKTSTTVIEASYKDNL